MQVEINIDDYLTDHEKKELCIEYVKETLRGSGKANHEERVLSNMAYHCAETILDSVLTTEMMETVRKKAAEVMTESTHFGIFRKKDAWGQDDSPAYKEVLRSVEEHKHLINPLVKQAIIDRDYLKDLPDSSDYMADMIIEAIKKGLTR